MYQSFYVLVQCRPGSTYDVGEKIAKSGFVSEVHSISGEWDLLLRIEVDVRVNIGMRMEQMIVDVGDIRRTQTFIAYHLFDPDDIYFSETD